MRKALLATAVAVGALMGVAGAAQAQDANWQGVYVGTVGGAGLFNYNGGYGYYYGPDYNIDITQFSLGAIGGTAGVNFQFGNGVFGIENDWNWSSLGMFYDSIYGVPDSYYIASAQWNWFTTLRARSGIAVGNALFYATGGIALVNVDYNTCYNQDTTTGACVPSTYDYNFNGNLVGLAIGGGVEFMIGANASVKLEYLQINLPTVALNNVVYPTSYATPFTSSVKMLRAGLNLHF